MQYQLKHLMFCITLLCAYLAGYMQRSKELAAYKTANKILFFQRSHWYEQAEMASREAGDLVIQNRWWQKRCNHYLRQLEQEMRYDIQRDQEEANHD